MNDRAWLYALSFLTALASTADVSIKPSYVGSYQIEANLEPIPGHTGMRLVPPTKGELWKMTKTGQSTTVQARVGVAFGVEYPADPVAAAEWRTVMHLPSPGVVDEAGKRTTKLEFRTPCPSTCQAIYIIENESEILPGTTRIELWHDRKLMNSQAFTIRK